MEVKTFRKGHPEDIILPMDSVKYYNHIKRCSLKMYKPMIEEGLYILQKMINRGNIYLIIDQHGYYWYLIGRRELYDGLFDANTRSRIFGHGNKFLRTLREYSCIIDEWTDPDFISATWGVDKADYQIIQKSKPKKKESNQKSKKEKNISYGVYGMYYKEKLVYIGMTMRVFEDRWKEHIDNIMQGSKELKLYSYFQPQDINDIQFKILINCKDMQTNSELTRRDVESMELAMINYFRPQYNLSGVSYPYQYSGK